MGDSEKLNGCEESSIILDPVFHIKASNTLEIFQYAWPQIIWTGRWSHHPDFGFLNKPHKSFANTARHECLVEPSKSPEVSENTCPKIYQHPHEASATEWKITFRAPEVLQLPKELSLRNSDGSIDKGELDEAWCQAHPQTSAWVVGALRI